MKYIIAILLLKVTASAAATTHYDTILNKYYVDIVPKVVVLKMPAVTRLYVNYDSSGYAWDLLCTPLDTNRFTILDGVEFVAPRPDSFEYVAEKIGVSIID